MKILFVTFVFVNPITVLAADDALQTTCSYFSESGRMIMELRQSGMPITEALDLVDRSDEEVASILDGQIKRAYEIPKFSSEKIVREQITEFGNNEYLWCYEEMGKTSP